MSSYHMKAFIPHTYLYILYRLPQFKNTAGARLSAAPVKFQYSNPLSAASLGQSELRATLVLKVQLFTQGVRMLDHAFAYKAIA